MTLDQLNGLLQDFLENCRKIPRSALSKNISPEEVFNHGGQTHRFVQDELLKKLFKVDG